jgi:hypothetical protein
MGTAAFFLEKTDSVIAAGEILPGGRDGPGIVLTVCRETRGKVKTFS